MTGIVSISLPADLSEAIGKLASEGRRSVSEIAGEALHRHLATAHGRSCSRTVTQERSQSVDDMNLTQRRLEPGMEPTSREDVRTSSLKTSRTGRSDA